MAKETTFPHPPRGHVGLLAYDSVLDKWRAVYIDAEGNLQVDVAVSELPDGAATAAKQLADGHNVTVSNMPSGVATAAKQLADGHNVTVDNASLAVTGTFYLATQPVDVEGYDPVPTTPVCSHPAGTTISHEIWGNTLDYTVTEGTTFYLTDIYLADIQSVLSPEFIAQLRVDTVAKIEFHVAAGCGLHEHLNTPLKVTTEQAVDINIFHSAGGDRFFIMTLLGFEV